MNAKSFQRLATVTASTKRAAMSAGKRGTPSVQIATLKCLPLDPVDAEIRQRIVVSSGSEVLQTFVDNGLDIVEADILVVGSKEYPIRAVEDWAWKTTTYRRLILEDVKR